MLIISGGNKSAILKSLLQRGGVNRLEIARELFDARGINFYLGCVLRDLVDDVLAQPAALFEESSVGKFSHRKVDVNLITLDIEFVDVALKILGNKRCALV